MSLMSNEAIQAQIAALKADEAVKIAVGDDVVTATGGAVAADSLVYADSGSDFATNAMTASKLVYANASKVPTTGTIPFPLEITAVNDTTFTFLDLTGRSSISTNQLLSGTFVQGAQVTTFTAAGFVQVNITDAGDNITDGVYYVQFGLIS